VSDFLTKADVARLFRISSRTVERWVEEHRLPPPLKLSAKVIRWRAADIERALEEANTRHVSPKSELAA